MARPDASAVSCACMRPRLASRLSSASEVSSCKGGGTTLGWITNDAVQRGGWTGAPHARTGLDCTRTIVLDFQVTDPSVRNAQPLAARHGHSVEKTYIRRPAGARADRVVDRLAVASAS